MSSDWCRALRHSITFPKDSKDYVLLFLLYPLSGSVFMMRGPSYRGRGLDTYSVEAVPQAIKVRGMQPKGV